MASNHDMVADLSARANAVVTLASMVTETNTQFVFCLWFIAFSRVIGCRIPCHDDRDPSRVHFTFLIYNYRPFKRIREREKTPSHVGLFGQSCQPELQVDRTCSFFRMLQCASEQDMGSVERRAGKERTG